MSRQSAADRPPTGMTFDQFVARVRYDGAYPTRERAEQTVRAVLGALGRQLTGQERADLAARLPVEAALLLNSETPDGVRLTGWSFVKDLATRAGTPHAVARWDTGTVLTLTASLAGPELLTRVLDQLPSGYALLFGRAELARAA